MILALRNTGSFIRSSYPIGSSVFLVVFCSSLCGCSDRSFDRERFAENAARYATKPLHKALYINSVDFALYQRFGGADVQDMLAQAEQDCKESSKKRGVDPGRCAPLYMDDARLLDPALYL
jgi:hypothetical protein